CCARANPSHRWGSSSVRTPSRCTYRAGTVSTRSFHSKGQGAGRPGGLLLLRVELGLVAMDPPAVRVSRRTLLQRLGTATQAAAQLPVVEAVAGWSPVAGAATVTVTVGPGSSFSPSSLTINVGDTVVFSFAGGGHIVTHGSGGSPPSPPLFHFCRRGENP